MASKNKKIVNCSDCSKFTFKLMDCMSNPDKCPKKNAKNKPKGGIK